MKKPKRTEPEFQTLEEQGKDDPRLGKKRWIRIKESPFSRAKTYRLIFEGKIFGVVVRVPGTKRTDVLIDADSLDRFLLKLGREQQAQRKQSE